MEVVTRPTAEAVAGRIAVPSTAVIAMIAGAALVGLGTGIAGLTVAEPDDGPQRALAVVGMITGAVAFLAAAVAAVASIAQRRNALSALAVDEQRAELDLAAELMTEHPEDVRHQERGRRLLDATSDSYTRLIRAGALDEARRMLDARTNVERVLASVDRGGK